MTQNKVKKRGRPKGSVSNNPMVRMPDMKVKKEQLEAYKAASEREEMTFSAWVRSNLDKASK